MKSCKLDDICKEIMDCNKCDLEYHSVNGFNRHVVGTGNENANIMFVFGTATYDDIACSSAASGRFGKYFDRILHNIGLNRDDIFLTSSVLCHMKDRDPLLYEVFLCKSLLYKQIRAIAPKLIVTFGSNASLSVIGNYTTQDMLGKVIRSHTLGVDVFPMHDIKYMGPYVEECKGVQFKNNIRKLKNIVENYK